MADDESTDQSSTETEDSIEELLVFDPEEQTEERKVQVEVVLRILRESIEKLKISLLLPRFFQNPITVRQYLEGTKYQPCAEALDAFLKKNKDSTIPPLANFELVKLIDKFQQNFRMLELLPSWVEGLSSDDMVLLDAFQFLYTIAEQRLPKTAKFELAKERKLHKIYHKNEQMKRNIEEFEEKVQSQKTTLQLQVAAEGNIVQRYEDDLALKKLDNNLRVKKEVILTTRRIKGIHASSVTKQRELEEELEKAKAAYEKVLKSNLHQEKEVRDEKNKLLLQLQALIRKFDTNIGEKIKENMDLQDVYAEQKKEFDQFMVEFRREEMKYDNIIRKKEEEERRRFEHRLVLFMMRRAARTIQFYWRRYRREMKRKPKYKGK